MPQSQIGALRNFLSAAVRGAKRCVRAQLGLMAYGDLCDVITMHVGKGATVLDIGANIGDTARAFAKRGAHVIAFEPQPEVCAALRLSVPANVHVENIAVGDSRGYVTFYLDMREGMKGVASSMMELDDLKRSDMLKPIRVQSVRLDEYVHEHGLRPTFIKIDVEGCEPRVFEGGMETIRSFRPVLVFEFWESHLSRYRPWFDRLSEIYTLTRLPGGQEVREFYSQHANGTGCIDILCLPRAV